MKLVMEKFARSILKTLLFYMYFIRNSVNLLIKTTWE